VKPREGEIDHADIRASLAGDEAAYARMVDRYEAQVFAQMWRFTRDRRVLEELAQDVFVEGYLNLRTFRGEAPFLHWLRRIGTRVGYRYWKLERRARERRNILARQSAPRNTNSIRDPSEAGETLFRLLEVMAPRDRLVLTLYYFEDCDTKEIAERTGWSQILVRVQIHRARRRLKRLLVEAGYGRSDDE
jgi:RNA polymerase sigma-70 factor (ECF subfamily)